MEKVLKTAHGAMEALRQNSHLLPPLRNCWAKWLTEMKSFNHRFSMAAAESDKDSGYSGLEKRCVTSFVCYRAAAVL